MLTSSRGQRYKECIRVGLLVGEVHVNPTSHTDDNAVEPCLRWCCRDDIDSDTMSLPSHPNDGAAEMT
jgi:hypothetical protein